MNLTFKEQGEVVAKIVGKEVVCDDNKLCAVLQALVDNYAVTKFPENLDADQLLEDSLRAFAMVNSYEVE
ncbi:MAG: hypothetical protein ABS882_06050 [Lysinibacillus sp.]